MAHNIGYPDTMNSTNSSPLKDLGHGGKKGHGHNPDTTDGGPEKVTTTPGESYADGGPLQGGMKTTNSKYYKKNDNIGEDKRLNDPQFNDVYYDSVSEVQSDKKGDYVTSLDDLNGEMVKFDGKSQTEESANLRKRKNINGKPRDTIRPKGGRFTRDGNKFVY